MGIKENLEKEISLGIAFAELRERRKDREEARRIMQDARGSRQEEVNRNLSPAMAESENEEKGGRILMIMTWFRIIPIQQMVREGKAEARFRPNRN